MHTTLPRHVSHQVLFLLIIWGNNFKCWKGRVLLILKFTEIDHVFYEPKLEDDLEKLEKWAKINKLCKHIINSGLANNLFDNLLIPYFVCLGLHAKISFFKNCKITFLIIGL